MVCKIPRRIVGGNKKVLVVIEVYSASGGAAEYSSVTIAGVSYTTSATVEVNVGTQILCIVEYSGYIPAPGTITLNSSTVATATSSKDATYTYTATKDCNILIDEYQAVTAITD